MLDLGGWWAHKIKAERDLKFRCSGEETTCRRRQRWSPISRRGRQDSRHGGEDGGGAGPHRHCEPIKVCCFKPPCLLSFVKAALGS